MPLDRPDRSADATGSTVSGDQSRRVLERLPQKWIEVSPGRFGAIARATWMVGSPSFFGHMIASTRRTIESLCGTRRGVIASTSATLLATLAAVARRMTALSRAAEARAAVMSRMVPT